MSDVVMLAVIVLAAMCPTSLLVGTMCGILIARELKRANGHDKPAKGPVVVNFGDRPDRYTWLNFQPENRIGNVVKAMEKAGFRYSGRVLVQEDMWHLRFLKAGEQEF